mgnify:CR=1 FL=1
MPSSAGSALKRRWRVHPTGTRAMGSANPAVPCGPAPQWDGMQSATTFAMTDGMRQRARSMDGPLRSMPSTVPAKGKTCSQTSRCLPVEPVIWGPTSAAKGGLRPAAPTSAVSYTDLTVPTNREV